MSEPSRKMAISAAKLREANLVQETSWLAAKVRYVAQEFAKIANEFMELGADSAEALDSSRYLTEISDSMDRLFDDE